MSDKGLIIEAFSDEERSQSIAIYTTPILPLDLKHQMNLLVSEEHNLGGDSNLKSEVKQVLPESIQFEILLDGTGVLDQDYEVKDEIEKIKAVLYYPIDHKVNMQSPFLILKWGAFEFPCLLESLQINYLLFKNDGNPLRAKLAIGLKKKLNFTDRVMEYFEKEKETQYPKNHVIKQDDNLYQICKNEYNDASLYLKVAKYNNIPSLVNLEVGKTLVLASKEALNEF